MLVDEVAAGGVGVAWETNTAVVVLSNTVRSVDRLGLRLLKALPGSAG